MSISSEPGNPWAFMRKPAQTQEVAEKKKTLVTNFVKGQVADVSLPQVATGGTAPFIMGRDIIRDPDMIWYGNLQPIYEVRTEQTTETDPNTGSQTITTTITTSITGYTIDIQFCTGLGPGVRLRSILLDNTPIWTGTIGPAHTDFTIANNDVLKDVTFAGGNFDQAVDAYLQARIPQPIPAYRGISYVVLKALDTTKLGNLSFEVDRYPDPLALGAHNKIGDDINPVSAIAEIITRKWGGAGRDIAEIGSSFATVADTVFAESNGCSIVNRNPASSNDLCGLLLDQIDATLWEDHETGKIEITPYRKSFDRTNLVRVFDKDIIKIDQMNKTSWQSVPTRLTLKYVDRVQNYAEIPVPARNLAVSSKISKSGKELSFPAVRVGSLAAQLLAREGASSGSPIQQINITTNRKTRNSNPGDIILITCEKYKYYSVPAIVTKRRTQPVDDNTITLQCNVILYPNNNVLFASPADSFFESVDPSPHTPTDVKLVSAPFLMRIPNGYVNGSTFDNFMSGAEISYDRAIVIPTGANSLQRGVGAYILSGADYVKFPPYQLSSGIDNAVNFTYPVVGKLKTAIDKYDNWDGSPMADIVIKNAGEVLTALNTIIIGLSSAGKTPAYLMIDDEIFLIDKIRNGATTVVWNAAAREITIHGCYRGMFDTVAQSHAANAFACLLTSGAFRYNVTNQGFAFASTPDLKFTGISLPKGKIAESSISVAFPVTTWAATDRARRPLRPHDTKINGSRGTSSPTALTLGDTPTISWKIRSRATQINSFVVGPINGVQTDPDEIGEIYRATSKHIVYRVMITDSANVDWDCGATADTADHSSLVATVPLGAAVGVGSLWVQAEFNQGNGNRLSLYRDRLPITLS